MLGKGGALGKSPGSQAFSGKIRRFPDGIPRRPASFDVEFNLMKTEKFRVPEGKRFRLKKHRPDFTGGLDQAKAEKMLAKNIDVMAELQDILYAQNVHALLIIFQAMDAAGKDGAIRNVMSGLNPQGCHVVAFKQPSAEELDHDFLWRCAKALPERGRIGIFNRSHYEEVLVVRVHPQILENQQLPEKAKRRGVWKRRFAQIRNFEDHLAANGIHVIKFFLNVSKEEQKKRFLDRIAEPEKNWKFSAGDVKERAFWDDYQLAYEEAIAATSTDQSPWYVIPADNKWFTRLVISEVIVKKLESLKLSYPKLSEEAMAELLEAKMALENE
jgi:PPK2 family polyphosphate:nucleotide phosphotransferase